MLDGRVCRGVCTAPPPPTIEEVQKLVQTISGDEVKLKAYCELGALYEQV